MTLPETCHYIFHMTSVKTDMFQGLCRNTHPHLSQPSGICHPPIQLQGKQKRFDSSSIYILIIYFPKAYTVN